MPAARPRPAGPRRTSPLAGALSAAVTELRSGSTTSYETRRRVEQLLREALARHQSEYGDGQGPVVGAVRVACAQLAAGDVEDAYLALLTARERLR